MSLKPPGTPFSVPKPKGTGYRRWTGEEHYGVRGRRWSWRRTGTIGIARATDNIDLDMPFIVKPADQPPVMSVVRVNERWFFRLKPGSDFYDAKWGSAFRQGVSSVYGLALAYDGSYIWGTRANEVWRMPVPGVLQIPPQPGSGEGAALRVPAERIIKVQEQLRHLGTGELYVELDNSDGAYAGLPTAEIDRGYLVRLKYGYRGRGVDYLNAGRVYFIEDWSYVREAGRSSLVLHCIDAWGLLERCIMPAPADINYEGDQYSVYELIELLVRCIGGSLSYRSRSSLITTLYPDFSIRAGESAADIIRDLLELVPDTLIFDGLDGYIIHPQKDDDYLYEFHFADRSMENIKGV